MSRRSLTGAVFLLLVLGAVAAFAWEPVVTRLQKRGLLTDRRFVDPSSIEGTELDYEAAVQLFAGLQVPGNRVRYDEQAWIVLEPDREDVLDWHEHPTGQLVFRTNNLGFREDAPTQLAKSGTRILVAGDSHTEGAVPNPESFANVLEGLLNDAAPEGAAPVEVLNAGVGGTGPHNFLAMLRKYDSLEPDLFIATLYSGNDFLGALMHSDFLTKRTVKARDADYFTTFQAASKRWRRITPQGFNQAFLFRYRAGDDEVALQCALSVYEEMARECAARGIDFLVLVLPTKPDVDLDDDRKTFHDILDTLDMSPEEYGQCAALAARFVDALGQRGIPCLDVTAAMRESTTPQFWRTDHHLNTAGHRLVADAVFERIRDDVFGTLD